ncbi:MAG: hypothetical protein PHE88_06700 [Elusimicrobia bacterium]|nr:hypothetical protein [Elusimicrobiota bacterium]
MKRKEIYLKLVLEQIPRLLGQLDRVFESPTYGCFDRQYWNYLTKDFSSIIPQYATLSLALIYYISDENNIWFKNTDIKRWCIASMLYWAKIQHDDGSFDEAYPYEHSQPGTAFSLYFIAEAYDIFKDEMDDITRNLIFDKMKKALEFTWNYKKGELNISNHSAGNIAAFYKMYTLDNDEKNKNRAAAMLTDFVSNQSKEGWFPEYGSADIGYSTVTLYFLANYYRLSNDKAVLPAIERLIEFISYFVHPDGSIGGEYGSRETSFVLPSALEIMANGNKLAKAIICMHHNAIISMRTPVPSSCDDANLLCFLFISYLQAYLFTDDDSSDNVSLPFQSEVDFKKHFEESGLLIVKTKTYYSVVSSKKGGVLKAYNLKNKSIDVIDLGWVGNMGKYIVSSNKYNSDLQVKMDENKLVISANFCYIKMNKVLTPLKMIVSRFVFYVISPLAFLRTFIKEMLRKYFITDLKKSVFVLQRTISFLDNKITINDILKGFGKSNIKELHVSESYSPIYGYSKGLYRCNTRAERKKITIQINDESKPMEITRVLDLENGEVKIEKEEILW